MGNKDNQITVKADAVKAVVNIRKGNMVARATIKLVYDDKTVVELPMTIETRDNGSQTFTPEVGNYHLQTFSRLYNVKQSDLVDETGKPIIGNGKVASKASKDTEVKTNNDERVLSLLEKLESRLSKLETHK